VVKVDDHWLQEEPKAKSTWEFREDLPRSRNNDEIISLPKTNKLVKRGSPETHNLHQEIPALEIALENQKEDLRVQHMDEKLKLSHDHMLTMNTMQKALTSLNDNVISLKEEVRRLKSIKGLNANARVFNPTSVVFSHSNSPLITSGSLEDQQITVLSNPLRANDLHNDIVNNMSGDRVLHISPGMLPDSRDSSTKVATSQGSSGVSTPSKKQRKKKGRKKNRRKAHRSRRSGSEIANSNKYLATSSKHSSKHHHKQVTSSKDYNKRVQHHGQSPLKSISQTSSQTPEQEPQYKLKGLMMGPHDPNVKCQPIQARKSTKKNKRNCYHKSKD